LPLPLLLRLLLLLLLLLPPPPPLLLLLLLLLRAVSRRVPSDARGRCHRQRRLANHHVRRVSVSVDVVVIVASCRRRWCAPPHVRAVYNADRFMGARSRDFTRSL
jgi:hypothetical protein